MKAKGCLGQRNCSRLATVWYFVSGTLNSLMHQKRGRSGICKAHWPQQWTNLSPFTWSVMLVSLSERSPACGTIWNVESRSHSFDSLVYWVAAGSTYWGQVKWHILSLEKGQSAAQRFVPLAGASMSKVLKLLIFSSLLGAVWLVPPPPPD